MAIQWDESLRLGESAIDKQHKEIFEHFDKLTDAIQNGNGKSVIQDLLAYLDNYASVHIKDEEGIMEQYNYPYLEEQRKQHHVFKENIEMLTNLLNMDVPMQEISIKTDAALIKYFIVHVRKLDKALAEYIKQQVI
jgi:hemerythrin